VLTEAVIKIGKLASSHLRLDDESVSRMHAVLEVNGPDELQLIDLGSTRGTLVNGERIAKASLKSGIRSSSAMSSDCHARGRRRGGDHTSACHAGCSPPAAPVAPPQYSAPIRPTAPATVAYGAPVQHSAPPARPWRRLRDMAWGDPAWGILPATPGPRWRSTMADTPSRSKPCIAVL